MHPKKRICLVIPSLHPGGMERVMSELALYFCSKEAYEVHLILYGMKREIFYQVPDNIQIHKPSFDFKSSLRTVSTLKTMIFLRNKIKEINPETILSFGELWNNFVLLATLGLNYHVYVSDRCQPDKSLGRFHDILRKWLYPKSAGVICQTETAKQIYKGMFHQDNFVVIGNPIREIAPNSTIKKENIVLSIGRLIKSKHHDSLIRMFTDIKAQDWKLIIVGGDALQQNNTESLSTLISELGMQDKIELVGNRSDVDNFYNQAKIFAFTSSSEGFPNVIGEAMSAGLPAIAYNCIAGPSDLIEHEHTGYLVELHNSFEFKSQLEKLMHNEFLRDQLGQNAKISIKQFSVDQIAHRFEKTLFSAGTSN